MAGKQEKIRMKPKSKSEISGPLTFEHVHHVDPGKNLDGGGGGPTNGPCPASPCRLSSEYCKDFFNLHLSEELKYLIRSEISMVIKEELEPYRRLAREKSDTLLVRPIPDSTDQVQNASLGSVEHDDDMNDEPVYVNSNAKRQGPRLKRSSLSNPIYDVKFDEYIDANGPGTDSIVSQSSVPSETAPKKPMPSPRPHAFKQRVYSSEAAEVTLTDIDNQSARHTSPHKSFNRSLSNPNTKRVPFTEMPRAASVSVQTSIISETQVKQPHFCPGPNTLPRGHVTVPDRRPSEPLYPKKGVQNRGADERQCLANALQTNIEDIVDNVIFAESELPDALAADSCITDEESSDIRKLPNKKDQVRVLISTIKGRDLVVLRRFLRQIDTTNKEVADKVKATFEGNVRNGVRERFCACCEMKSNVNIKYVVDGQWAIRAISDGLFTEIARCASSTGEQCVLWMRLMDSLNSNPKKEMKMKAYSRLIQDLSRKNHYNYIAEAIKTFLARYYHLGCRCKAPFRAVYVCGSLTEASSCSPYSSTSDVRHSSDMLSASARSSDQEGGTARSSDQEAWVAPGAIGQGQPQVQGKTDTEIANEPTQDISPLSVRPLTQAATEDTIKPTQDISLPSVPPRTQAATEGATESTMDTPGLAAYPRPLADIEPSQDTTAPRVPPRHQRQLQRQNAIKASDFISSK